jgi:hypothetical protein
MISDNSNMPQMDPSLDAKISLLRKQLVASLALPCLDHNAYHLGEAILLRRLLGIW